MAAASGAGPIRRGERPDGPAAGVIRRGRPVRRECGLSSPNGTFERMFGHAGVHSFGRPPQGNPQVSGLESHRPLGHGRHRMVRSIDDGRRQASAAPRRTGAAAQPRRPRSPCSAPCSCRATPSARRAWCAPAEDFYKPAHGHVFDAILTLHGQGEPADPVTVADELRRAGLLDAIGGPATLVSLQAGTPATSNAASYAKIVEEHALLRRLIAVAGEIAEIGYTRPRRRRGGHRPGRVDGVRGRRPAR